MTTIHRPPSPTPKELAVKLLIRNGTIPHAGAVYFGDVHVA
jgi:hypothetical protein